MRGNRRAGEVGDAAELLGPRHPGSARAPLTVLGVSVSTDRVVPVPSVSRSVRIALAGGLALLVLAVAVTLLGSPVSVAHTNKVPGNEVTVWTTRQGATYCQAHESLPARTSAVRIWLFAAAGPRVHVDVLSHGQVVTHGSRGSIWVGGSVTIPVAELSHTVPDVTVCVSFPLHDEGVVLQGNLTNAASAAREGSMPLLGRMGMEFLRAGTRTWASQAPEIARRMGLGRAFPGTWIAFLPLALVAAIVLLFSRLVLRELAS